MKKILYFFPRNPINNNEGSKTRALELLKSLKRINLDVDFVFLTEENNLKLKNTELEAISLLKKSGLANNYFPIPRKPSKKNLLSYLLLYKLPLIFNQYLNNYLDKCFSYKKAFKKIPLNSYDYIIISYVYSAVLIEELSKISLQKRPKLIIDTHDFISAQEKKSHPFYKLLRDEIRLLNLFDEVWAISNEENYIFSQFCNKPITTIPCCFDAKTTNQHLDKDIDIVYVAGDNPHNRKAADWFFLNVYPLLSKDCKITVVGKIGKHITEHSNIIKIDFTEDLDPIYSKSRIAICPMLSGTGVKIKIIEALSYGLPIVCNERGLDGLINKTQNGCLSTNDAEQFAEYINELLADELLYQTQKRYATAFFNENYSTKKLDTLLLKQFSQH